MDADPTNLIVPADDVHCVLADQHACREKDMDLTRKVLVGSRSISKGKTGWHGSTTYTVPDIAIAGLARSVTDTARNAPAAAKVYPYLEARGVEMIPASADDGDDAPDVLALWLRDSSHILHEAIVALFMAGARGDLGPKIFIRFEITRKTPAAELTYRDRRSGIRFRRVYKAKGLAGIALQPDYQGRSLGTSLAYRLHREYFEAVGELIRNHGKVGGRHEAGRPRRVTTKSPTGDHVHSGETTLHKARGQDGGDLLSESRLGQQGPPPWKNPPTSSLTQPVS